MNDLSRQLLDLAYKSLKPQEETPERLDREADKLWVVWRNRTIEAWGAALYPLLQDRPASYFLDPQRWNWVLDQLDRYGLYYWELPLYEDDEADDDEIQTWMAHFLAVMWWIQQEALMDHLDYTSAELNEFLAYKQTYSPPRRAAGKARKYGEQISMF